MNTILSILEFHLEGISEFDLLKELERNGFVKGNDSDADNAFTLFQTHFLLFNELYKLREHLIQEGRYDINIHCLKIQLIPLQIRQNNNDYALNAYDPLASYYLDWKNFETTSPEDVEQMIEQFWKQFLNYESKKEALEILGLSFDATESEIKSKYRELVLIHHPDRGGEKEKFEQIANAMEILRLT